MKTLYRLILGIVICYLSVVSSYAQTGHIKIYGSYNDNGESYDIYYSPFQESDAYLYFADFDPTDTNVNIETTVTWNEDGIRRYSKVPTTIIAKYTATDKNSSSASAGIYDYKYMIISMPHVPENYRINDVKIFDRKLDPNLYIKDKFFLGTLEYLKSLLSDDKSINADKYIAIGRWTIAIPTSYFKDGETERWLRENINKYGYLSISVRFKNKLTNKFDVWKSQCFNDVTGPGIVDMDYIDDWGNAQTLNLVSPSKNLRYYIKATPKHFDCSIKKDISTNPMVRFSDNDKGIPLFEYWKRHLPDDISSSEATEDLFWRELENERYGLQFKGLETGFRLVTEFEKKHYLLKLGDVTNGVIELEPSSGRVPHGTEVNITAIPNDNCKLSQIYLNGKPITGSIIYNDGNKYKTSFTIEENTVVSAEFVSTLHNITKKPSVNGKYTISQELNIPEGSEISVTATPDEGYVLDKIMVNGKAIKGTTFIVNEDCTVEVVFKKKNCYITCTIVGDGAVEVTPGTTVPYGTEITVNPVAGNGFILEELLANGKRLIDRKLVVTHNVEIFASFIKKPDDMLNIDVLDPIDGKLFARNATTGEYYTGNSEIRANTLLLLKIEYDKNKYDFGGFTFDGKVFDGYQLRIERKGVLSAILKPKSEYSLRGAINIETTQNGIYTITTPDKYMNTEISVIDIMGRVISKHKIQSNITTIDLSTQHSGILLLKFNDSVKKIKHRRI